MTKKKHKSKNQSQSMNPKKGSINSLGLIKEALTLIGGLAGSVLAVYGLVKTFRDDAEGFSWFIPVGIVIWLIFLWRLFQVRKTAAYSLFIVSVLAGVIGWVGWQSQVQATEKKIVVLVTRFDGPEETYGLRDQILEQLRAATENYVDTEIIASDKLVTVAQGSEYARQLGEKNKADLVIWAWYRPTDNPNITIHVENLSPTVFTTIQDSSTYKPEATLIDLKSYKIQKELGADTSSLIAFLTGYLRFEVGDYKIALERFDHALQENNKSLFVPSDNILFWIGSSHFNLGEDDQAITAYTQVIHLNPNSDAAYNNRGYIYFGLNQYEKAINDYTQSIKINPYVGDSYNNRGIVYNVLGQYENALSDFTQAIQIDPNDANSYSNRGSVYQNLGQIDKAISDYTQAIKINPNFDAAYGNRGSAYQDQGQFKKAVNDYTVAIQLKPFAFFYDGRGIAYGSLGQYEKAINDFNQAIKSEPNNPTHYNNRGTAYNYMGQYDKAISDYTYALQLNPNAANTYNSRGIVFVKTGKYNQAITDFTQALQIDPQFAEAYYDRGSAYQKLGRTTESEADYKNYEELTGQKP
jgi:tetratricopeptide (TPR) repeat protein